VVPWVFAVPRFQRTLLIDSESWDENPPLFVLVSELKDGPTRFFIRKSIVDKSWDGNV
jgi:hypothetical protein